MANTTDRTAITWRPNHVATTPYFFAAECDGCGTDCTVQYWHAIVGGRGRTACGQPCAQRVHDEAQREGAVR